jgi:hypothetical protein
MALIHVLGVNIVECCWIISNDFYILGCLFRKRVFVAKRREGKWERRFCTFVMNGTQRLELILKIFVNTRGCKDLSPLGIDFVITSGPYHEFFKG